MSDRITPKPLPEVDLPELKQVGKPLRRVDGASLLREAGRESTPESRILASGEPLRGGEQ